MKLLNKEYVGKQPVYDLTVKDKEQYIFENGIVSHNTGIAYAADNVIIIGRRQIKEGTEIAGYQFVLNAEKSRMVKEKSKMFLTVTFDGGIDRFSGLLDIGLELGFVVKPKNGWYQRALLNEETGELLPDEECKLYREVQTRSMEFWKPLFLHKPFIDAVELRYKVAKIVSSDEVDEEVESIMNMI